MLLLYRATAAPDMLSGDSGEFQFAAPLLAIPHPTGYPLYILLGKMATFVPMGSIAFRVTLVSVVAGAATVALLALLVWHITGRALAALVSALVLAVAPGMWNAATLAEVYALNMLLLVLLACLLWYGWHTRKFALGIFLLAACVTGLGVSLHGSFVFVGAPLLLGYVVLPLVVPRSVFHKIDISIHANRDVLIFQDSRRWVMFAQLMVAGIVGLVPWLFVFLQYYRWSPFNGLDHGLVRFHDAQSPTYFWGAPTHISEAIDHLFGGVMRGGVFSLPDQERLYRAIGALGERLWFEVGVLGLLLGLIGFIGLYRRALYIWLGTCWVFGATLVYFVCLGQAVQDAIVFTLPILLPLAVWVGVGAAWLADTLSQRRTYLSHIVLLVCLALTIWWGTTRYPYSNKSHLWLFRTFGEGVLAHMAPDSVVMVRWEQGTMLQYLRFVEGQRPDVWVDIVEPGDEAWRERAVRRYTGDTVYIIGNADDGANLGAKEIWGTEYSTLFELVPQNNGEESVEK